MFLTPRERIAEYEARGWWEGISVDTLFRRAAAEGGARTAVVDPPNRAALDGRPPERLDWIALEERVGRMSGALLEAGLRKDDVICVQLPNIVDAVILFLAAARLGLVISPVVMQYRDHELEYLLGLAPPRAIVTVPVFAGHDHAAMALRLASTDTVVLVLGPSDGATDLAELASTADPLRAIAYAEAHPVSAGEVLTLCWTSGTEARPKGVPRDHNHWVLNARLVIEAGDMRQGETLLNPFPLVNIGSIGGLVMPWLAIGGTLVLHHPFDLAVFIAQIAGERVNYTIAPPALLTALLKQPAMLAGTDLSSLRAIGSGSAPLSPWLIQSWRDQHGVEVCNMFGSNEGTSLFSNHVDVPDPADRARYFPRFGGNGLDWPCLMHRVIRSRLIDPATEEEVVEPGRLGELRVGGAFLFNGYWGDADRTREAFDAQGFFRTGDLFEIAGEGDLRRFYRFVGRSKEIVVRGGVNISPAELDDLLAGLPSVREAATVGLPDPDLGERLAVVVVPDGRAPSLADIARWLDARGVAKFKWPERLVIAESLPRNAMNKVVRSELRQIVHQALAPTS
ncbi:class I adenylate-forming enzyme family protein [Sphingosinicella terrae]|uniref:class I adenylate-forming enzyme family protein n=1 Tax=Sphingosinicella terrae TaxID=2172047 RepID=UPI000E0D7C94|nr:class I adenylate-forming enzyme family protein [Sphingosinicella terrae]